MSPNVRNVGRLKQRRSSDLEQALRGNYCKNPSNNAFITGILSIMTRIVAILTRVAPILTQMAPNLISFITISTRIVPIPTKIAPN